jgi:hypothetical protein
MNDDLVSGLCLLLEARLTRYFPEIIKVFIYWTTYFESSHASSLLPKRQLVTPCEVLSPAFTSDLSHQDIIILLSSTHSTFSRFRCLN